MIRVAIDGPGGSGKSTIAKAVANQLSIDYIDTGAMYRAIGLKMSRTGIPAEESEALQEALDHTSIDFDQGKVFLDGVDVSDQIRTPQAAKDASAYSALGPVRRKLVEIQKSMASSKSVVMDGRDIGTNVIPDAECKIYLTATSEERAQRRYRELVEKGIAADLAQIQKDIEERDWNDTHRELDPLRKAEDARELDTTHMTIEQVMETILDDIHRCMASGSMV